MGSGGLLRKLPRAPCPLKVPGHCHLLHLRLALLLTETTEAQQRILKGSLAPSRPDPFQNLPTWQEEGTGESTLVEDRAAAQSEQALASGHQVQTAKTCTWLGLGT